MYQSFAKIYDLLMSETPYEDWCRKIDGWIGEYGISQKNGPESEANLVLELGCGTGMLTELLAVRGYDCIGVDNSPEMLAVAADKKAFSGHAILYLCQDMREMELYSTVGTVVSVCDSLNYLLTEEEIVAVFRRVNNYLYPGGLFIFDFNTSYKYADVLGDATIAENREECSFIWENYYHEEAGLNEYDVTFFAKEADGRYRKFQETHYQRGYTREQMEGLVKRAGMEVVAAFDSDTDEEAGADSERIFIIAREYKKKL